MNGADQAAKDERFITNAGQLIFETRYLRRYASALYLPRTLRTSAAILDSC